MAQVSSGDPHGLFKVWISLVDPSGYATGTSGTVLPADGTLVQPREALYPQSAEISIPERTVIDFTGSDTWSGSYVYGITSLGTSTLTTSTIDAQLVALLSDSVADNVQNTRTMVFAENVLLPTPPQACMAIVFRIQSKEAGSVGANKFLTMILPRVWVAPQGIAGAPTFQGAGTYNYTIIPTVGDRMPWGPLFSDTALSFERDQTPMFYMITDNPVHFIGFVAAAGATEDVTLPFKPAPTGYDYSSPDSAADPVQLYIDGEQYNATSIVESTGVVTTTNLAAGAFTGGEYIGIFYETNYVAPA